ncbi:MAG TPA: sigma-70 family RNA polymerase sigma factor [Thermoanaerobaculia bacterium]|nr:sigma-70 family RNA polymerase sigma factor [Thermoanaerobaculia bacterium]
MDAAELFGANLALIERVARGVCWRKGLRGADVEDFVSAARLALIENDYAILRGFSGRSSLATFLAVVFHRHLADQRIREYGRWNASRDAERLGPAGVLLESLLVRERRPLDEAVPIVLAHDPSLTRDDVAAMAERLPHRVPRPRPVAIDESETAPYASADRTDADVEAGEVRALSARVSAIMRGVLGNLSLNDRTLVRLRYGLGMSIADVSRMMRLPQRPLYRRYDILLQQLRSALLAAGVASDEAMAMIGTAANELDFGLGEETDAPQQTTCQGGAEVAEESS